MKIYLPNIILLQFLQVNQYFLVSLYLSNNACIGSFINFSLVSVKIPTQKIWDASENVTSMINFKKIGKWLFLKQTKKKKVYLHFHLVKFTKGTPIGLVISYQSRQLKCTLSGETVGRWVTGWNFMSPPKTCGEHNSRTR